MSASTARRSIRPRRSPHRHDVWRRAQSHSSFGYQCLVDAEMRPDLRLCVPSAQAHGRQGYAQCTPRNDDPSVGEEPWLDFSSGYVSAAITIAKFPKQIEDALSSTKLRARIMALRAARGRRDEVREASRRAPGGRRRTDARSGRIGLRRRGPQRSAAAATSILPIALRQGFEENPLGRL